MRARLIGLLIVGGVASGAVHAPAQGSGRPALRDVAAARGVRIGAAVEYPAIADDSEFAALVAAQASVVTPENRMKFGPIHPEPDRYDFAPADAIMEFASENDLAVRGHTLVWHSQNPSWLDDRAWTRNELIAVLRNHIDTVVGRYRGRIAQWDVVNEALNDDGTLRDTIWSRVIGPRYLDLAFRFAREADPDATLFYNDYFLEYGGPKADAALKLVLGMRRRGVPVDGVGFQMHMYAPEVTPSRPTLERNLRRFSSRGFEVAITELDIALTIPATDEARLAQAVAYRRIVNACLALVRCRTIVTWGWSDRYSWIPTFLPGRGAALLFDENLVRKPAYYAVHNAFETR